MKTTYLIIGAGISGLATANFLDSDDFLILEREPEIGGWCKTIVQDGFVWDFSGHFFHFRHPEIEAYLRDRMPPDEVLTVVRDSRIHFKGTEVDFPFQKNIHQLPKEDFIDCLHDLFLRDELELDDAMKNSFEGMLYEKFGKGITERFLKPYNEKLYACDLNELDREAMGRFFPHADIEDIVRNMRAPDNRSYNSTFTYPKGGAIQYVRALTNDIPDEKILLGQGLERLDLVNKVAHTSTGEEISFEYVISSAPFDRLLSMTSLEHDASAFSYNKVLVFNLGFDSKGPEEVHWTYFPEYDYRFYRIGFYDNIMNTDRMSLYVEIGYPADGTPDVEAELERTLQDLEKAGIVDGHELVSWHTVTLDPAYVHITQESRAQFDKLSDLLKMRGVHSIGRYGGWTYCSIEDNIVEARELAKQLNLLQKAT
jgi:protoporphyrinogen oxidase